MILASIKPGQTIAAYKEIRNIEPKDVVNVLRLFLDEYGLFTNRYKLEMFLADNLLKTRPSIDKDLIWPDCSGTRGSSFTLHFICFTLGATMPFWEKERLCRVYSRQKIMMAQAWAHSPQTLTHVPWRQVFLEWLSENPKARLHCLLGAARLKDSLLMESLSPQGLSKWIDKPETEEFLRQALRYPELFPIIERIINLNLGMSIQRPDYLSKMLNWSSKIGAYQQVVTCSEMILDESPEAVEQAEVLVHRLVALARLNRDVDLAVEYENRWMPLQCLFPKPSELIYSFQRQCQWHCEKHLLKHSSSCSDPVFTLSRELHQGTITRELFEKWSRCYFEDPGDEARLFGVTRCAIRLVKWTDGYLMAQLRERWRKLADYKPYRNLAGAMLVFISDNHRDKAAHFETYLQSAPSSDPMVARATVKYLRSLAHLKNWKKLEKILDRPETAMVAEVCSGSELLYHLTMARQTQLPKEIRDRRIWLRQWETLLSLPMHGEWVINILGHFLRLENVLHQKKTGDAVIVDDHYQDVRCQITRRVKQEAARLLYKLGPSFEKASTYRADIQHADSEKTYRVSLELAAVQPYAEEFLI